MECQLNTQTDIAFFLLQPTILKMENVKAFMETFFRSLRKVMLRTCIGDGSTAAARDYPNYAENKIRFENGNGDLSHHHRGVNHRGGGSNHWRDGGDTGHHPHTDLKEAMSELLPEEIPGLPRHRPGEFSPR